MSAVGSIGMVPDRALNLDLLDLALKIATKHRNDPQARRLLSVALRDVVTPQEAENKTKKVLTRVWVVPPDNAQDMITWAIDRQDKFLDRRALHYGALLAAYPFFGSIAATVTRQIRINGTADRRAIRTFARSTFGQREYIDAGASKILATMRNLRILDGPKDGPYKIGARLEVPASFSAWFLHALILTRQVESARVTDLSGAAELAPLHVTAATAAYPMLEFHAENGNTVAVTRRAGR
jgi:hypothetical protein